MISQESLKIEPNRHIRHDDFEKFSFGDSLKP
jgi:hypothetical protein